MTTDFHGLLYAAHKNEITKEKSKARYYPSSFGPPKKEEKSKGLSVNVKKFLARKEEEEKLKKIEEERKREALLQLRNQDNKAKKRVQVMLKRTKSYNKSVLEDAIDEVNTADTMNGPQQCDEDDYGYVSQEASSFYSKMMEKYGSIPSDDNKFSKRGKTLSTDLHSTKDRVKMALQRQEEEEMGPHKRKRKKKDDEGKEDNDEEEDSRHSSDKYQHKEREREKEEKPKPRRSAAAPPIDFTELLKLAEKKQYEPPPLEVKLKEVKRQQQKEPERLMTKKEKLEYERTRDKRLQKESGTSSESKKDSQRAESKPDRKEKEKEDERKKLKEQRMREDDRNRRQREAEQERRQQEKRRQEARDQERRRQEDREQERRRHDDREQERRRLEDREQERRRHDDREPERRRQEDRERERRLEDDRERQREKERIRELEEELARHKERERQREQEMERKERERKLSSIPRKADQKIVPKSSSSSRPTDIRGKQSKSGKPLDDRPTTSSKDYRNGDVKKKSIGSDKIHSLFGDRDSVSPERPPSKTEKPKPRPVERIKISNSSSAGLDDLFGDNVTIRTKQKPAPNSSSSQAPSKSCEKLSNSSKSSQSGSKLNRDKVDLDRKRSSDVNGKEYPEKRPKLGDSSKPPARKEFPPKDLKSRQFPPSDVRSRQFPPADMKSRQFPPADMKSRQFPPPDVRSRQFPPSDLARKNLSSNRRYEYERADSGDSSDEDEDEYDSEMDDFIDDGPENGEDYSKYIKDIFGYDKSRYANDSDGECAESNYTQVMREEVKSAKIGLMEDIEDMRKEEMEKKLKAQRKAAMKGRR